MEEHKNSASIDAPKKVMVYVTPIEWRADCVICEVDLKIEEQPQKSDCSI